MSAFNRRSQVRVAGLLWLVFAVPSPAATLQSNDNFIVLVAQQDGDDQGFTRQVCNRANHYRDLIAREWLGEELPPGVGRTTIHVNFDSKSDKGLTWAKDSPNRKMHNVFLTTSRERAVSTTLAHEMAHVVLATEFPNSRRLAPWVEEGIASHYDDDDRKATRAKILRWIVRSENWPTLIEIMNRESISTNDQTAYAVASSVTEWLVSRQDKMTFVAFARDGQRLGWDAALRSHYGLRGVSELEREWRASLR